MRIKYRRKGQIREERVLSGWAPLDALKAIVGEDDADLTRVPVIDMGDADKRSAKLRAERKAKETGVLVRQGESLFIPAGWAEKHGHRVRPYVSEFEARDRARRAKIKPPPPPPPPKKTRDELRLERMMRQLAASSGKK
jgi:hypothetical protein